MRRLLIFTFFVTVPWLVASAAAAQSGDPRDIIERAIKAQGGVESLARAKASFHKTQGMFHSGDLKNIRFMGESYSESDNRANILLRGEGDEQIVIAMIINGDKVWDFVNGNLIPFDKNRQKQMRIAAYADKVTALNALLKDNGFTITSRGETKVKQTTVRGITVNYPGMPDIDLYFDKVNGFLVKCAYRTSDETGKEFFRESYYSRFETYDPSAEPLKVLKKAKLDAETPSLFAFLQERLPSKGESEKIDFLILELGRTAFSAREKASAALLKLGSKAAGPLRLALKSADLEVARRAEQLLGKLSQSGESELVTAVVRLLAVRVSPESAKALLDYLPAAYDESVLKEVKYALVSIADADGKSRSVIHATYKDGDSLRKSVAAEVLGEDGGVFLQQPGRRMVVDGLTLPRVYQLYRDGQLSMHIEAYEYQFFNRLDESLFNKPGN